MTPHDPLKSEVGIRELHDQLSRYMRHVAEGGEVIVTSRGKRIARLSPIDTPDPLATLRARGLVSEPSGGTWEPNPNRPVVDPPISDLVKEQRR